MPDASSDVNNASKVKKGGEKRGRSSSTGVKGKVRKAVVESPPNKVANGDPKVAVLRQSSFDQATDYVAKKSGCNRRNAAISVFLTLVLVVGGFTWLVGPEVLLTLLRTGDLPDSWPICNGRQLFFFCECAPGYSATGAVWHDLLFSTHCKACALNEAKMERGNQGCSSCPPNAFSEPGSTACSECEPGHFRGAGGLSCRICAQNMYRAAGIASCLSCPINSFSAPGSKACSLCKPGHFRGVGDQVCRECPRNSYRAVGSDSCTPCPLNSASKPGSKACTVCEPGFIRGAADQVCNYCPRNTYRESANSALCRSCGEYAFTNSTAKDQPRDCICNKGGFRSSSAKVDAQCVFCPVDHFKNFTGDGECTRVRKDYKTTASRDNEIPMSRDERISVIVPYKPGAGLFGDAITWLSRVVVAGGFMADDAGSQLVQIVSYLNVDFAEQLESWYEFLFGSRENFNAEYEAAGGTANASDWEAAGNQDGKKGSECPLRNADEVTEFCKKSDHYKLLIKAKCKSDAKAPLKQLSLSFHPDRFNTFYRACDDNLSQATFIHFREVFDKKPC